MYPLGLNTQSKQSKRRENHFGTNNGIYSKSSVLWIIRVTEYARIKTTLALVVLVHNYPSKDRHYWFLEISI